MDYEFKIELTNSLKKALTHHCTGKPSIGCIHIHILVYILPHIDPKTKHEAFFHVGDDIMEEVNEFRYVDSIILFLVVI